MTFRGVLLLAATTLASTASGQNVATAGPESFDEETFVRRVLGSGPAAAVVEKEIAAARAESAGAGLWPNPSLSWQREDVSRSGGRETQDQVFASIPLVLSGRLGLAADAANLQAQAAQARGERSRTALWQRAVILYTRARTAQERTRLLRSQSEAFATLAAAIAVREKAGDAAGYDRLRIELEASSVAQLLRAAEFDQRTTLAEALALIGASAPPPPDARFTFTGELAPIRALPDLATATEGLERRRGDARALSLEAQAAQRAASSAGRSWIPDPTVTAGVQTLGAGTERGVGYVTGLSIPLPFFEHGQGPRARAVAARDLAEARLALTLNEARVQLAAVFASATGRREQLLRHRREVLPRALQLRTAATAAYRAGGAELLVLVDAERTVREAQLRELDLAEQVVAAETDLLLLSGAWDGAAPGSLQ